MGMPTSADYPLYLDGMIDSPAGAKVDQVSVIGSVELTGMRGTTTGTGLQFRGKPVHKRLKKSF